MERDGMKQELWEMIPEESSLVNGALKNQLKEIFSKLDRPVRLVSVIDRENSSCIEMGAFLKTIASLNEWIQLEFFEKGVNLSLEKQLNAEFLPVVGLFQEEYLGVVFHGVPGGKEMNSFALAIYNAAGPGQPIEDRILKKIKNLKRKTNLKVCVSLSCNHCSNVVTAGQRIALLNSNVTCEMLDARLYPQLVEKYKITYVPTIIMNNSTIYVGEKDIEELLKFLR